MSTTAENELRKVYKDHNLHVLFGVTLMVILAATALAVVALVLVLTLLR